MSFSTENAQAVIDAYGGVYPVHPDADADHRRCLAVALCKVIELVFKDMPTEEFSETHWHQGYWSASISYKLDLLDVVDALMLAPQNAPEDNV